jgi:hypothetical protein
VLPEFRHEFYRYLTARADELFELVEAVLCPDGPVRTLVDLALAPEHRRGHGALCEGLNHGRLDVARLQFTLAATPLPRAADRRIVLAADVSRWLRPDAETSPDRAFCHTYDRGKDQHHMIPDWPYSIVAALETGRTSCTALLDAVRLPAGADAAAFVRAARGRDARLVLATDAWEPSLAAEAELLIRLPREAAGPIAPLAHEIAVTELLLATAALLALAQRLADLDALTQTL